MLRISSHARLPATRKSTDFHNRCSAMFKMNVLLYKSAFIVHQSYSSTSMMYDDRNSPSIECQEMKISSFWHWQWVPPVRCFASVVVDFFRQKYTCSRCQYIGILIIKFVQGNEEFCWPAELNVPNVKRDWRCSKGTNWQAFGSNSYLKLVISVTVLPSLHGCALGKMAAKVLKGTRPKTQNSKMVIWRYTLS